MDPEVRLHLAVPPLQAVLPLRADRLDLSHYPASLDERDVLVVESEEKDQRRPRDSADDAAHPRDRAAVGGTEGGPGIDEEDQEVLKNLDVLVRVVAEDDARLLENHRAERDRDRTDGTRVPTSGTLEVSLAARMIASACLCEMKGASTRTRP